MLAQELRKLHKTFPSVPGVYQMLDKAGTVLYVGKAKNLKKRVASYFRTNINIKTQALMQHVVDIEFIVAASENEALLLESTLIKQLKPKYNMVFKDDKSYPYIHISEHRFPRLSLQREKQQLSGRYYGPYPNATVAHEALNLLYKIFLLRQCKDGFFQNRTRPCVQYQIKRCSAPCVGYISAVGYEREVRLLDKFLCGNGSALIKAIKVTMRQAAVELDYETAAHYRDQIAKLQQACQQHKCGRGGNFDVVTVTMAYGTLCIQMLFVRNGQLAGGKNYFPKLAEFINIEELLSSFLAQYYSHAIRRQTAPEAILVNIRLLERLWLESALSEKIGRKIVLKDNVRGTKRKWLDIAAENAEHAIISYQAKKANILKSLQELAKVIGVTKLPQRLECFDISHTMGEATVASCVVFDQHGPVKAAYRRFNISNITKGDDYAAIEQALTQRYKNNHYPDVVIIDGGKGQLARAKAVLADKNIIILGIAKGLARKPGEETLYLATANQSMVLAMNSPVLHLLQRIRDEAHRFAISGHRHKLAKAKIVSVLENIAGIGSQKRKELLKCFGSVRAITKAELSELAKVPGISKILAQRIYAALHTKIGKNL